MRARVRRASGGSFSGGMVRKPSIFLGTVGFAAGAVVGRADDDWVVGRAVGAGGLPDLAAGAPATVDVGRAFSTGADAPPLVVPVEPPPHPARTVTRRAHNASRMRADT